MFEISRRLLVRRARGLKCLGCAKCRNSFVRFRNEDSSSFLSVFCRCNKNQHTALLLGSHVLLRSGCFTSLCLVNI